MPRTKRTRPSMVNSTMASNATVAPEPRSLKEILDEFEVEKKEIENYYDDIFNNYLNTIENMMDMIKINLEGSLNKNLYNYIIETHTERKSASTKKEAEIETRTTKKKIAVPSTSKVVSVATKAKYNGSASISQSTSVSLTSKCNSTVSTSHSMSESSTSKSINVASASKYNGVASSSIPIGIASRTNCGSTFKNYRHLGTLMEKKETDFDTPMNRPPLPEPTTVTAKVDMNQQFAVMRRPNQGEVALSMTGSPLMVSSVCRDDMPTVSVPLANGNILSILPKVGNTMDVSFDDRTKNDLLLLKGNIEKLLKKKVVL